MECMALFVPVIGEEEEKAGCLLGGVMMGCWDILGLSWQAGSVCSLVFVCEVSEVCESMSSSILSSLFRQFCVLWAVSLCF